MCEDKTSWARDIVGQDTAIKSLWSVFHQHEFSPSKPTVVFLGGHPGSGRTTVIRCIRDFLFTGNLWEELSLKGCTVSSKGICNQAALDILNKYTTYVSTHSLTDVPEMVSSVIVIRDIESCPRLVSLLINMNIVSFSVTNFPGLLLLFVATVPWSNAPHRPKEQLAQHLKDRGITNNVLQNATMVPLILLPASFGPLIVRAQLDKTRLSIPEQSDIHLQWQKQTECRLDDIWQIAQNGHHTQHLINELVQRLHIVLINEGGLQHLTDVRASLVVTVDVDFSASEFVIGPTRFPTGLDLTLFEPFTYVADIFQRLHQSMDRLQESDIRAAVGELLCLSEIGVKMFTDMVCGFQMQFLRCSDRNNLQKIVNSLWELETRHPLLLLNLCTLYGDDRAALLFDMILRRLVPKYGIEIVRNKDVTGRSIVEYVSSRQLPKALRVIQSFHQRDASNSNENGGSNEEQMDPGPNQFENENEYD